ncbi:LolA-related protein [uncultured Oxalicibacterium sp.]|uniref:LolA-related protein n=1 Tax=uncultured Oxalicibacterium sp. TaxID=1168540 RepID=UPI0025E620BB|nr:LolA-related protein [uncultured Oxalicibacterium sp.]
MHETRFPLRLKSLMQRVACATALGCGLMLGMHNVNAADWNMDQLMASLAQTKPGKVNFVEKKYISTLDRPVESSGELLYTPPNKLEKRTLKPKPERMVLERNMVTLERGKHKFAIDLDESPELSALIESIRATLAGDRRSLELNYVVALTGTREQWKLALTPSDFQARQKVKRITLSGTAGDVREVEVQQADGDRSVMSIEKPRS